MHPCLCPLSPVSAACISCIYMPVAKCGQLYPFADSVSKYNFAHAIRFGALRCCRLQLRHSPM